MFVWHKDSWITNFLDATPGPGAVRISVERQIALFRVQDQFFERDARVDQFGAYLRSIGPRRVYRKVRSRRGETYRNESWVTIGIGRVEGADEKARVCFLTTEGPAGSERVVLDERLILSTELGSAVPRGYSVVESSHPLVSEILLDLAGWSPDSGTALGLPQGLREVVSDTLAGRIEVNLRHMPAPPLASPIRNSVEPSMSRPSRRLKPRADPQPSYVCIGLGQYAKTQVLPNLRPYLRLAYVSELNPMQLGPTTRRLNYGLTTGPVGAASPEAEAAVVAGFHHTHAGEAIDMLRGGVRHVLIEKPICTDSQQLKRLLSAIESSPRTSVHVAFQRRHSPFNAFLWKDVGPTISMSAVVYEVPLPRLHWYRWPVSGNSIVSNGCHWIDHFLCLNSFTSIKSLAAHRVAGQVLLAIELENGASASLSIRHAGSPRLGVRDTCHYWSDSASAVVVDSSSYRAERGYRLIRKAKIGKYRSHELMYRSFGRAVLEASPGDTPQQIAMSAQVVLELAAMLDDDSRY